MIDKRLAWKFEPFYGDSDFQFRTQVAGSVNAYSVPTLRSDIWYEVDKYVYTGSNGWREHMVVLTNDKGVQIESAYYGLVSVETEHQKLLKKKRPIEKYLEAIGSIKPPEGGTRLHAEILELIENHFEEELSYV